jgi:PAS domain S-box-containing protein
LTSAQLSPLSNLNFSSSYMTSSSTSASTPFEISACRDTLHYLAHAVFIYDGERRFRYLNAKGEQLYGRSAVNLIGKRDEEIWPPEVTRNYLPHLERARATGEPQTFEWTPDDSHNRTLSITYSPLREASGEVTQITALVNDITARKQTEARLAYHLRLTETIANHAAEAFFLMDDQGRVTFMNPAAEEMLGWKSAELLGKVLHDAVHYQRPDGSPFPMAECPLARVMDSGHSMRNHEDLFFKRDGTPVSVRCSNAAVFEGDKLTGAVLVVSDITGNKKIEEELRASVERFRSTFDQAAVGLAHVGVDGQMLRINDRLCEILGYSREDLQKKTPVEITHPDDLEADLRQAQLLLEGRIPTYSLEKRYIRGDGSIIWTNLTVSLQRHADGTPLKFIAVVEDISARKQIEASLRESESRFRELADAVPQIVWVTRPDGFHEYYNRRWYEFTGVPAGSTDGEGWSDVFHPDDQERARSTWQHSLETGEAYEIEYRLRHHSGVYRWALGRALPIRSEGGEIKRWFGTCTDIEEFKRLQAERERLLESERSARLTAERESRLKDEFLSTLSHELRTPLNAILGWSQLIRDSRTTAAEIESGARVIERNARAQAQLIEDLLDMSRIITGKLRLDMRQVNLADVVEAALATVQPTADAKGVRLRKEGAQVDAHVFGDPARLQQIVWNLLSNAVKFTPRDGRVEISLARVNSYFEIAVTDTGEGIAPEFLPYVFERFRQADSSSQRRHGGLGLGLAIVKQLVELHGGTARVQSAGTGQGATFIVAVPIAAVYGEPAPKDDLQRHEPESVQEALHCNTWLEGVKVLVVDDQFDNRELVRHILQERGAHVATAESAQEAMKILLREPWNALISDLGMPDQDGYELIRQVRALPAEKGGQIPAMLLTAYARADDRRRAIAAGYQMHLSKPFEPQELITGVATLAGAIPDSSQHGSSENSEVSFAKSGDSPSSAR